MDKFPLEIRSVTRQCVVHQSGIKMASYILNKGSKDEYVYSASIKERHLGFEGIVSPKVPQNFIHGYKVVLTNRGECAYVRESDGKLLPYRFDFATNFNEYGFAMVAKDGKVTWMNESFECLVSNGQMVDNTTSFKDAFLEISNFSGTKQPLSKCKIDTDLSCFFSTDGKVKQFFAYEDGQLSSRGTIVFRGVTDFNDDGYAFAEDRVLFLDGYWCRKDDLLNICMKNGMFFFIENEMNRLKLEQKEKVYVKTP